VAKAKPTKSIKKKKPTKDLIKKKKFTVKLPSVYPHPGQPMAFQSPEAMAVQVDKYFTWASEHNKPLTIERLAIFLGITSRCLREYKKRDAFFPIIKRAMDFIIAYQTERLVSPHTPTGGIIFYLKNRGDGWTDSPVVNIDQSQHITLVVEQLHRLATDKAEEIVDTTVSNPTESGVNAGDSIEVIE